MSTSTMMRSSQLKSIDLLAKYFLAFRELHPILFLSGTGWSFLAIPSKNQAQWDGDLDFLTDLAWPKNPVLLEEPPFQGGWIGFLSYEQGMDWLGVPLKHPARVPRQIWRYCDRGLALSPGGELVPFGTFDLNERDLPKELPDDFSCEELKWSLSKKDYLKRMEEIHEALSAGETYQVNFAQELRTRFFGDPFAFYLKWFHLNPAAMTVFWEEADFTLVSNSPERLVSCNGPELFAEPIKGTIPKDADPKELLDDEKSNAELTMIVDLLRNDLGRIAEPGSVEVPFHRELMHLSSVIHTYSRITARLRSGFGLKEVLKSLFPGGSVTGCPKKRTMEWIAALENFPRGAYCGSVGYVSKHGRADFNILIRSALIQEDQLFYASGGGIVYDSQPEMEYQETLIKAASFALALNSALHSD